MVSYIIFYTLLKYYNLTTLVFRVRVAGILIAKAEKGHRNLMITIIFLHLTEILL